LLQRSFLLPPVFTAFLFFIFLNVLSPLCCVRPLALHSFLTARISCSTIPSQPKTKKVDLTVALLTRKSVQQKGLHKKDGQTARAGTNVGVLVFGTIQKERKKLWEIGNTERNWYGTQSSFLYQVWLIPPKAYLHQLWILSLFLITLWAVLFCYFGYLSFPTLLLDMPTGLIFTFLSREATIVLFKLLLTVVFFGYYVFLWLEFDLYLTTLLIYVLSLSDIKAGLRPFSFSRRHAFFKGKRQFNEAFSYYKSSLFFLFH